MAQGITNTREEPYELRTAVVGSWMYIGQAEPGTPPSLDRWRICRKDVNTLEIRWAALPSEENGSADFNKVWDNKTSYTYG